MVANFSIGSSMIYKKQQIISSNYLTPDVKLSELATFQIVENAITECMSAQHIDGKTIKAKYNAFWVFTKNKVQILDRANWLDVVTVECFISSKSAAKLCIDTAIKNADGVIIAYSRCEMCPLDGATGQILRVSAVGVGDDVVVEPAQMAVTFDKIYATDLPAVDVVTVRSTNIDMSRHANNVEYLRFILNTYTVAELAHTISAIEVNYVNQSYEGDVLTIRKLASDASDVLAITKSDSIIVKCKIVRK